MEELKTRIAKRAARELNDGDVVNLGIGLPTMVANNLPEGISIILQSENGIMGMGEKKDETDPNIVNAGAQPVSILPGGQFFDSATSFALIRGGHVDATILGALQVDEHGNLSNWIIPGKMVPGMGGAMDLVTGAKKVIVAMLHTQKGAPKILKECTLPYTALHCVDMIITEMGVMRVTEKGIVLEEIHPDYSVEDVQNATGCNLIISEHLSPMQ
ncbi:MAG: 3-oxoacid CoA-transferase subunit B [Anaerovoracaceae bacterium]|nr:3-oxoacid CoA-transferase subunit B [Anaerovoracaceae bacterium]